MATLAAKVAMSWNFSTNISRIRDCKSTVLLNVHNRVKFVKMDSNKLKITKE
jgi:hypothetical protein